MAFQPVPVPFSDLTKLSNDLLTKDFPLPGTTLEVKTAASNGVLFTVKGTQDTKGAIAGNFEGKYADRVNGLTLTQGWSTANLLTTKVELDNHITKGLKIDALTSFQPETGARSAKLFAAYKQPAFHGRTNVDVFKGPTFEADAVVGHDGFLAGAQVGYDVQSGRITRYAAGAGYSAVDYTVGVQALNNLSIFQASYYHKVNAFVEAGGRATWAAKEPSSAVSLEVGGKYVLDPFTSVKAKINNSGIAGLSYTQIIRPGVTVGLGASIDTQRLTEAGQAHKLGLSVTFSG
ncbi:hypothetical protein SAICODRAFT_92648 [Saitoella complicata NRRL Y-17804]|uniref:uncharacterized protein n=1 Tax=Saitoella complicata (strain BCRC 22490 / CBS 7301 / JCM 7358 / NBRC 10748 / NRRL Y-17804) TaxID=698492 RepID=UPI0008672C48|nr:uncharacterized protein SAICODRAFT_92648 [Saitoella complicata NRRL Y-17804]ODQ52958.1 hypothetical protein SAICODRAFT_92648 [Saitoella complicata NRRL Y-17804]